MTNRSLSFATSRSDRLRALNISDPAIFEPINNLVLLSKEISLCSCAYLAFISDSHEMIRFSTGCEPLDIPIPQSVGLRVLELQHGKPTEDLIELNSLEELTYLTLHHPPYGFRSFLVAPIATSDGFIIGHLCLASSSNKIELTRQKSQTLRDLAAHAARVIELHNKLSAVQRTISSLEDSEERFRRIADASPVLLWISDQAGNRTLSNKAWCDFTGLTEEDSLAECWRQAVHPKDLGVYKAKWSSVAKSGTQFNHEYRIRHVSGTYRWVIEQAIPLFSSSGRLEAYVSSCLDLSLRNSEELQFQHNEARFRAISEAAPLGIVVADSNGNCIYSNQRFQETSCLSAEECLGSGWLKRVHNDDIKRVLEAWRSANKTAESFEYTIRFYHDTGSESWCTLKAATINSTDTISGWVITVEDITAKRRADEEVLKAKQSAINAMNAKSQFLANMSHEIRTPLTAIIGFAESLVSEAKLEPTQNHCVELILNNGKHLLNIINQILDLSKIDAGALTLEKVEFSLLDLIDELYLMFAPTASEKEIKLKLNFDSPLPVRIKSDPLRLKQILINLLSNAIKFTKEGSVDVKISWREDVRRVVFKVEDTGIGLTSDQLRQLFQPFYQANSTITRTFGGTGLGLSITKQLIEALGGSIYVDSELGRGSRFILDIPSESSQHQTEHKGRKSLSGRAKAPLGQTGIPIPQLSGSILFADDALDNRRLIEHLLIKTGIKLKLVENGEEAVRAALTEPFNLILMDVQMPVVDGLTATRTLRGVGLSTPIIAISAGAMVSDIELALAAGCNAHISKPFERTIFYDTIAYHLEHSKEVLPSNSGTMSSSDGELAALTRDFTTGLAGRLAELEDTIKSSDWNALRACAHKLKGSAGMYGFMELSKLAAELELGAKEGAMDWINRYYKDIKEEIVKLNKPCASDF